MVSLGCPKNRIDSEVILGLLGDRGYSLIENAAWADIIIINTCTFIQSATDESIETILEYAAYKTTGNCRLLVVAGCLTQRYQEELKEELPEVDLFVGTGEYQRIAALIVESGEKGQIVATGIPEYIHDYTTPRVSTTPFYSSYIKIAEGCSNPCTFCIIPQLRGAFRSRSEDSIFNEVKALAEKGVKEFNLVAQDTTAYGRDLDRPTTLKNLLTQLVKIDDLEWIRLLYCYPTLMNDELIELIAAEDKIVKYIDMPLQHVDDTILKAMKRGTREKMIKGLLQRIKKSLPDVTLRSAFIVGFPGETEKEFENLLAFIEETRFDHLGVFKYSQEEGTPAGAMENQVKEELKEERYNRIMEVQQAISLERNREHVGKRVRVLVEGLSEETDLLLQGRATFQAPEIDGITYINAGQADVGDIKDVLITEAHPYDLVGEIIEEDESISADEHAIDECHIRP
ncbi:MAG: 30S ribosomal protein S12 methylthiotransferase RimO [Proteobacteria bacterium]|nr:30S ribosomal protein S12 methylthiotransferase RimO [Pseudomonadota bacterium]